ncbi:MAG: hypothetical protein MSC30_13225 [Gaiellaceae bacterium MAG52_C11]|nr:hypothetical protein [Candidatus Gaiellasilicea maunaloa]
MTKLLIGVLSLALVGIGGLVAAVDGFGDDRPVRSVSLPAGTTSATTTEADDISGPCDEAEHANDPRCTGTGTSTGADDDPVPAGTTIGTDDVSGPCDEPEHANDPRCTGIGTTNDDDDRSGPGGADDDDRSGSDDDSSGRGSGDD